MELADWIQTIILLVTIIGLIVSNNYNRKQLKTFNNQLKLNFFTEYTKRFQEIILNLPEKVNDPHFDFSQLSPEIRDKALRYFRAYFDLCSEEYDLWKAGYIEDRIWNNWKEGIEYAFSKTAYRLAWHIISLDSIFYPEFNKWVNELNVEN